MTMFDPRIEAGPGQGGSIIQYGVQPPNSTTALIVTDDRAQAECALELIPDGRVVHRTIFYSGWLAADDGGGGTDLADCVDGSTP